MQLLRHLIIWKEKKITCIFEKVVVDDQLEPFVVLNHEAKV